MLPYVPTVIPASSATSSCDKPSRVHYRVPAGVASLGNAIHSKM